jgi:uncharacterized protein YutE (UPF0331/DUF86 family)
MTEDLRDLLQQYGFLSVTLAQLRRERPGTPYNSLDEYYESLGGVLPDEPVLMVRISKDGKAHFLEEGEHPFAFEDGTGAKVGAVTVWELPEDEFWFFRAFRPALFDLEKQLPAFAYEMGLIHAYAIFEGYLAEILRAQLRKYPRQLGGQRKVTYEQVFQALSRDTLIEEMIDREIRDLMYQSVQVVLDRMRDELGFRRLTKEYDDRLNYLSLLRNCLLHNRSRVDVKLAGCRPTLREGDRLYLDMSDVDEAVHVLRKFSSQVDQAFEEKRE